MMLTDASGNATELITWYFVGRIALQFVFLSVVIYLLLNVVVIILCIPGMFQKASARSTEAASLYLPQVEILTPQLRGLPRQFAGAAYQFAMSGARVDVCYGPIADIAVDIA